MRVACSKCYFHAICIAHLRKVKFKHIIIELKILLACMNHKTLHIFNLCICNNVGNKFIIADEKFTK